MIIDQSLNQLLDPAAISPVNGNLYERIEIYAASNNPNQQWTFPGVVPYTGDNDIDLNSFPGKLYETINVKGCELIDFEDSFPNVALPAPIWNRYTTAQEFLLADGNNVR